MSQESKSDKQHSSDPAQHKKRLALFNRLLPQAKYVIYDLLNSYPVPADLLKDAIQEAHVKLYEKIVVQGEDHHTDSYYKQFARNRARNYLRKHLFRVNKREILVEDVERLLNARHKEDIQYEYEETVSAFSRRGRVWGEKTDNELEPAIERQSLDTYLDGASSDAWEAKWFAIQHDPTFSDEEKAVIEQLMTVRTEDRDFKTIRENFKMDEWDFDKTMENIKRKGRYLSFDLFWWASKLQRLTVEKFEKALEKIFRGELIYIPHRREKWTTKRPYSTQKVSSAV